MKYKIILLAIIICAAVIRFYNLGQNPPSPYWDEIALGYNAYSIAQTGYDEEGPKAFQENPTQFFGFGPLRLPVYVYMRSFGDFKPPVYIYSAVPMIKLFGLNEWTTRFPSAFFGTLSVFLTYALTRVLFTRIRIRDEQTATESPRFFTVNRVEYISLLTALLLALSPWHTQISRVAYEANLALFLVLVGVWAFLKALESPKVKTLLFLLSGISFVLTLYTFNSNRVFTPLLVLVLGLIYFKEIINKQTKNIQPLALAVIISAIIAIPVLQHMFSQEGQLRYKEVNIFSNPEIVQLSNERIARAGDTWWANLLNNRRLLFAQEWLDGYFRHFSGKFLFISGDINPRFSLQDVGQLYLIELPFLLIGIYLMLSRPNKQYALILLWLLIAPIPAAFAREVPHALRSLNILPTFQIIISLGVIYAIYKLKNSPSKAHNIFALSAVAISTLLLLGQLYYYQHNYYAHYPQFAASEWQYGYKQMVQKVTELEDQYDQIIVTGGLGRPYINLLFYKQYPPELFQQERMVSTDQTGFGFIEVNSFNKYYFREVNWKKEITDTPSVVRSLLVGTPGELDENQFTKAVIRNLKNEPVFYINELPKGQDALLELK